VGLAVPAEAVLQSRLGGQAYYDTVLDITWPIFVTSEPLKR